MEKTKRKFNKKDSYVPANCIHSFGQKSVGFVDKFVTVNKITSSTYYILSSLLLTSSILYLFTKSSLYNTLYLFIS